MTLNNPEESRIALIDLDGTLADFSKAMLQALNSMQDPLTGLLSEKDLDDPPEWLENRMHYVKSYPGFWEHLEVLPLGMQVLDIIRKAGYKLNILTKGPKKVPGAWTQKAIWAHKHVPDALITMTQDKGLVYGKILFDDWPPYIKPWLRWRPRGIVLMLAQPWNEDFKHPNVIRIQSPEDFAEVRDRIAIPQG